MSRQFSLVRLTCHDYLFYASRDYGASARPVSTIGNYALMYAVNRSIPEIREVVAGTTPLYDQHLPVMKIYATPASLVGSASVSGQPLVGDMKVRPWSQPALAKITWNSTGESLLWAMETESINIPKVGSYFKIEPLATFYFYTVGGPLPSVIRIGKKLSPARLEVEPLSIDEKHGRFRPTCPVNVADLPQETQILGGSLLTVPPAPLLLNADLEGTYIEGRSSDGNIHIFPVPIPDKYTCSWAGE